MDPREARSLIPLADHHIHMNHAGVSPMSVRGRAAIEHVVEGMVNRPYRDGSTQEDANRIRGLVGQLIHAAPELVALTRSTAHGISLLAQGLDWDQGDNVVGAGFEYPANVYPWMALAARGVELRQAAPVGGRITPDVLMALMDDPELIFPPSARKFEESVVSLLDTAAFGAALEILLEVGPEVIESRVLDLAARLGGGLAERGYELIEPWPRSRSESSGIVSFRKPGGTAQEVLRDLNAARVVARIHRDFVRLSPHFYNTDEEVDRVLEALAPGSVNR